MIGLSETEFGHSRKRVPSGSTEQWVLWVELYLSPLPKKKREKERKRIC